MLGFELQVAGLEAHNLKLTTEGQTWCLDPDPFRQTLTMLDRVAKQ